MVFTEDHSLVEQSQRRFSEIKKIHVCENLGEESEIQQLSGPETNPLPYPFSKASELLELCENQHWSIAKLIHEPP